MEENELDSYINEEVLVLERDEAKELHKNNLVMEKRIIVDSIKDHLIPQVSSLNTPKAMFDSLTKIFKREEHKLEDDFEKPIEECKDPEC